MQHMSRDEQLQHAIRLYNELARIRERVRGMARYERLPLEARVAEISAELRGVLDKHRVSV